MNKKALLYILAILVIGSALVTTPIFVPQDCTTVSGSVCGG
jgi:hypothetical protein